MNKVYHLKLLRPKIKKLLIKLDRKKCPKYVNNYHL